MGDRDASRLEAALAALADAEGRAAPHPDAALVARVLADAADVGMHAAAPDAGNPRAEQALTGRRTLPRRLLPSWFGAEGFAVGAALTFGLLAGFGLGYGEPDAATLGGPGLAAVIEEAGLSLVLPEGGAGEAALWEEAQL